jgi:hypothetical protein
MAKRPIRKKETPWTPNPLKEMVPTEQSIRPFLHGSKPEGYGSLESFPINLETYWVSQWDSRK